MTLDLSRRGFIIGLVSLVAAPALVRATSLMPIRGRKLLVDDVTYYISPPSGFEPWGCDGIPGKFYFEATVDGSVDRPFKSIKNALDYVGATVDCNGHRIEYNLADGHYREDIDLGDTGVLIVEGSNAVNLSGTIIRRSDRHNQPYLFEVRENSTVDFDDLKFVCNTDDNRS